MMDLEIKRQSARFQSKAPFAVEEFARNGMRAMARKRAIGRQIVPARERSIFLLDSKKCSPIKYGKQIYIPANCERP
jgi:hypothetical protein